MKTYLSQIWRQAPATCMTSALGVLRLLYTQQTSWTPRIQACLALSEASTGMCAHDDAAAADFLPLRSFLACSLFDSFLSFTSSCSNNTRRFKHCSHHYINLHHIYIDSSHAVLEHCLSQALLYSHLGCTSLRRRDDIKYNTLAVQPTTLFHMPSKAGCASPARPFRQDLSLHWHSLPSHPGKLPVTWSRCACSTIDNIARRLEFALRAGAKSQS